MAETGVVPVEERPASVVFLRRCVTLLVLSAAALAAVLGRLYVLQIQDGSGYVMAAAMERARHLPLPAPRGEILARHGTVLAGDHASWWVALDYPAVHLGGAELRTLQQITGLTPAYVHHVVRGAATDPYAPVVLKNDLNPVEVTRLEEEQYQLPGLTIGTTPVRYYPGAPGAGFPTADLAAQILGYVRQGLHPWDLVGGAGVEASYNGPLTLNGHHVLGLAGVDGYQAIQVTPGGQPQGLIGTVPPKPGNNVVLTIDAHLQAVAEHALWANMRQVRTHTFFDGGPFPATEGAAVAIDPRTGAILALASVPSYNPNDFAQGAAALPGSPAALAWQRTWAALNSPSTPGNPLLDHALGEISAPGSTFKPITALAALTAGAVTPNEVLPCPASINIDGAVKNNWVPGNYSLNLFQAIARSCDTYFYQVGVKTGIARIEAMARQFGLGQLTGQQALSGEVPGYVAGPDTQRALGYKRPWYIADTMDAAIGQGFNSFNPLEMANYVATLANGGTRYRPYLVSKVTSPNGTVLWRNGPHVVSHVQGVPAADYAVVHQAMTDVTRRIPAWQGITDVDWGTAYAAFLDWNQLCRKYLGHTIAVAGKTGTAQQGNQPSNSWFIAFAPAQNPQIAIAVFVREGDEGLISSAPVARDMLAAFFGIPSFEVAQSYL